MKSLVSVITTLLGTRATRTNLAALGKMVLIMLLMVSLYTVVFHWLMMREGQDHSWVTGLYWTLTVMTTLGFGDITFSSDAGRVFSVVVMLSGVLYLLVLLPFSFIEFFYAPWIKAQEDAKTPRKVPDHVKGHVVLTHFGAVEQHLIRLLTENHFPYYVLTPNNEQGLALHLRGVPVVVGDVSEPEVLEKLRVQEAAMVVTTLDDVANTNITFSVREISESVPVVVSATKQSFVDALELAGATKVLRLEEMLGQALARRVYGNDSAAHVIGDLNGLLVAEASPGRTRLAGMTLEHSKLRKDFGVTVVGLWHKGQCLAARPEQQISAHSVLVLAGTKQQIEAYNEEFSEAPSVDPFVVIVGGGRVGRVVARTLEKAGIDWRMVEQHEERVSEFRRDKIVVGDAADFETLKAAGLHDATSVIVTTHDDKMNIFLTIFLRRLRSDAQLMSRCSNHVNAKRLHRAGADLVLSYAAMGANLVFNELSGKDTVLLAEGVNIFTAPVPKALQGKTLAQSDLRARSGCSVIAVELPREDEPADSLDAKEAGGGERVLNPAADFVLPKGGRLILNGSLEAEKRYFEIFERSGSAPDVSLSELEALEKS